MCIARRPFLPGIEGLWVDSARGKVATAVGKGAGLPVGKPVAIGRADGSSRDRHRGDSVGHPEGKSLLAVDAGELRNRQPGGSSPDFTINLESF